MIANCPVCGKAFDVLWPHLWQYKRHKTYMCSYGCLRALDDKRGMNRDMNLTKEQRETVIDMALRGESPIKYIGECGIKNPSCTWWNLKKYLSKNDPETYNRLPNKFKGVVTKTPETPEQAPTVKIHGPIRIETPEKNRVEVVETPERKIGGLCPPPEATKCTKPLNYSGYDVSAIRRDELGEFYHDVKFNCVDWRTPAGDEVSLSPAGWRKLRDELPTILKILGVEA